jgi:hypothetical protein
MSDPDVLRAELIAHALKLYPFRPPDPGEPPNAYIHAVVHHIADHDWALAFEIRLGRRQADWTPADTKLFKDYAMSLRPPSAEKQPADLRVGVIERGGLWPTTDEAMRTILDELMALQIETRVKWPQKDVPIMIGVLMMTGDLLLMPVHRGDRIAAIKYLARNAPVHGFVLAFDAFMHIVSADPMTAQPNKAPEKIDCIIGHMGTRTTRLMMRRPYRYVDDRRRVEVDPPLEDIDPRSQMLQGVEDPYAEIFVSVPASAARPS